MTTTRTTLNAGVYCIGRKADGSPCRFVTRRTVEVAGARHATCQAHAAQVEAAELDFIARRG